MGRATDQSVVVAGVCARPGEMAQGYATVGEMQDHQPIRVPVCIINGAKGGPILYLQAASDGNELNGVGVVRRILKTIRPKSLRGAIIAVPLVNVLAFHAHAAHSPADGKKMNRCFPGKKKGTSSERIAHFLFHEAVLQANYCIDLHQGGVGRMIDECRVRVNRNERAGRASFDLGRVFGIGYISYKKGPKGQLARAAPTKGIPTIDPELGGCHGWHEDSIRKGVRGVMNVLRYYGLVNGKPSIPKKQVVVRNLREVHSGRGGFLTFRKRLYALVRRGSVIAEVSDPFGNVVEKVRSPVNGVVWSQPVYPMVAAGQRVANIGTPVSYV